MDTPADTKVEVSAEPMPVDRSAEAFMRKLQSTGDLEATKAADREERARVQTLKAVSEVDTSSRSVSLLCFS